MQQCPYPTVTAATAAIAASEASVTTLAMPRLSTAKSTSCTENAQQIKGGRAHLSRHVPVNRIGLELGEKPPPLRDKQCGACAHVARVLSAPDRCSKAVYLPLCSVPRIATSCRGPTGPPGPDWPRSLARSTTKRVKMLRFVAESPTKQHRSSVSLEMYIGGHGPPFSGSHSRASSLR